MKGNIKPSILTGICAVAFLFVIAGLLFSPILTATTWPPIESKAPFQSSKSSGVQSSSAAVTSNRAYVTAVHVVTNGSDNVTVRLYDGTGISGTTKFEQTVTGSDYAGGKNWDFPLEFSTAVYLYISGTSPEVYLEYIEK